MFAMGPSFWGTGVEISEYFTSVIYPIDTEDTLSISVPVLPNNEQRLLAMPVIQDTIPLPNPSISSVALTTVIAYKTYTTEDTTTISNPSISSAELTTVIAYKTYTTEDSTIMANPSISAGALTTAINYITLTTWQEEITSVPVPSIVSASLT